MLVTTKELLELAETRNEAVASLNVTGLPTIQAIIGAAEEMNRGVILEFATVHEVDGTINLDDIGPLMVYFAKKAKVPVAVHLDHAVDLDYIHKALKIGFTSIMFDGSALPYEENVATTKVAVNLARKYGATIEAELGKMAGLTLNNAGEVENRGISRENFTNPEQAADFVKRTGIDMLACSFGTSHGIYTAAPKVDSELVGIIHEKTGVPIVMHGSSGVNPEDYGKCIDNGVRKINYYTYMAKDGGDACKEMVLNNPDRIFFAHEFETLTRKVMKEHAKNAIRLFMNKKD